MFVYANLLGNWTKLTENDIINGTSPVNFVEKVLSSENSYETFKLTNDFVEVITGEDTYHIHKSCIQYTYKNN